jgi:hypothetical protein
MSDKIWIDGARARKLELRLARLLIVAWTLRVSHAAWHWLMTPIRNVRRWNAERVLVNQFNSPLIVEDWPAQQERDREHDRRVDKWNGRKSRADIYGKDLN